MMVGGGSTGGNKEGWSHKIEWICVGVPPNHPF